LKLTITLLTGLVLLANSACFGFTPFGFHRMVGRQWVPQLRQTESHHGELLRESAHRDYFTFGLSSTLPLITTAVLSIGNPRTGYDSSNLTETIAFHGGRVVSGADNGTQVHITLNAAALAAINAVIRGGGTFAPGGALGDTAPVPEPSSLVLLGLGITVFAAVGQRRRCRP
jgi:PEP-CTERM motif